MYKKKSIIIARVCLTSSINLQDMHIPMFLTITTGAGILETIVLKYSDIDFTANTIYIDRQLGRDIKDEMKENSVTQWIEPKTQKRSVALMDV